MYIHMFVVSQGQVNLLKVHVLYTGTLRRVFKYHFLYSKSKYMTREFYLKYYSIVQLIFLKIVGPSCFDE